MKITLMKKLDKTGRGGKKHVFPQNPRINQNEYRVFEGRVAKAVKANGSATVDIKLHYPNASSMMPNLITYAYKSGKDGETRRFTNPMPC